MQAMNQYDPTSSHDDFLDQILSSVPSSSLCWPDLSKSWDPHHHHLSPPLPPNPSSGDDHQLPPSNPLQHFQYDDQSSSFLAAKLRQHQITGGGGGGGDAVAAAKALLLQQQLLLSRTLAGNGLRSPTGASGDNGFLNMLGNGDQNDSVGNPANDSSVQALFNGFTGSLGQNSSQPQHFLHPQGGRMQAQSFGAPATAPAMNQTPAASGSAGGGTTPHKSKTSPVRPFFSWKLGFLDRSISNLRAAKEATMFPGLFMRKPDKAAALKQLKTHVALFGTWVAVIRVTPYILHYFSDSKEELMLEL